MAPINQLGYGQTGLNFTKELSKLCNLSLFPIGQPTVTNKEDHSAVFVAMSNESWNAKAPCVKIWHQHDMAQRIGSGRMIGFPIFELDTFSAREIHHLNSCDELMVCSQWAKDIVMDQCPPISYRGVPIEEFADKSRVHVVPLGVDNVLFKPAKSTNQKTVFFNCGKWEVRKGHDFLISVWDNFCSRPEVDADDVELWMMCDNPFLNEEEKNRWENLYKRNDIRLLPRVEKHEEVYNVMKEVDCGVFPSRAEGWNLEALELLSCGKQLIITNYSAHTEFCNKDNSYLVEVTDTEPAFDGKWFFRQGNWAKIGYSEMLRFVDSMVDVYKRKKLGEDITNNAGIETAQQFTWKNAAERMLKCL